MQVPALQLMPAGVLTTVPLPVPETVTDNWKSGTKVAVTLVAEFTVTLHVPVPVQAPPQPVNAIPASGAAVRITGVPAVNENEHVAPQLIPAGLLVTVPVPVPNFETVSASCGVKVAVTFSAALMVTLQAPVPVQAPLQPVNTEPAAGVAARLTTVPELYWKEQVAPQLMPAGELVSVPVPVPAGVTVNVNRGTKVAVTVVAEFTVTVQVPVPVQAPPQPVKIQPAAGTAVRVTGVPEA